MKRQVGICLHVAGRSACACLIPASLANQPATRPLTTAPAAKETADLLKTDSRAPYVHRLTLYDHDGKAIDPKDADAPPYSPAMTCGKCHPYAEIAAGWHFNAPRGTVAPGRPGEPWLLVDEKTGTQIPISARGWPGTFKPADVGLSDWQMVLRFGHHMPGGGFGEPAADAVKKSAEATRWASDNSGHVAPSELSRR